MLSPHINIVFLDLHTKLLDVKASIAFNFQKGESSILDPREKLNGVITDVVNTLTLDRMNHLPHLR